MFRKAPPAASLSVNSLPPPSSDNVDYANVDAILTFGTGLPDRQCFSVTILQDALLEGLEGFFLALVLREDFLVVGVTNPSVFILDDESTYVCVEPFIMMLATGCIFPTS